MANNIELLNREDAKDAKEGPPTPKAVSLSEKPGFYRGSAKSAYPFPGTRSIGIAAIGHGHGGTAPTKNQTALPPWGEWGREEVDRFLAGME
jgi:hypothetical protein